MTNRSNKNRIMVILLAVAIVASSGIGLFGIPSFAGADVIMGHAARGESGLSNQKAGDQTGKEVYTCAWDYNSSSSSARHWTYVFRCNDATKASIMAQVMKDACENDHVGYDKATYAQRQSFFNALKEANWDASKITKDVETTCTPLIAACINAAGINIKTDQSAKSLVNALKATGKFTCYTSAAYTKSSKNLRVGDILLSTGHQHGAMIVSVSGESKPTTGLVANVKSSTFKAGTEYQLKSEMNVRTGPGTSYRVKKYSELTEMAKQYSTSTKSAILNKGTVVTCLKSKGDWIEIPSGWVCGKKNKSVYIEAYKGTDAQAKAAKNAVTNITEESGPALTEAKKKADEEKKAAEAKKKAEEEKKAAEAKKKAEEEAKKKAEAAKKKKAEEAKKKKAHKLVEGKDYKLLKELNVRTGPGTNYPTKKKSELSLTARGYVKSGSKYAVFKKGTVVTCIKAKGDWMKIPSGWVCGKYGNVKKK